MDNLRIFMLPFGQDFGGVSMSNVRKPKLGFRVEWEGKVRREVPEQGIVFFTDVSNA